MIGTFPNLNVSLNRRRKGEAQKLSYYRARYYDPQAGRFVNEDPVKFLGGDINFYRYVWNHPTGFRDHRGLWGGGVTLGAGAFGGVGGNASGGLTGSIGGIYLADPSSPLGFTSAGYASVGAFAGDHGICGTPGKYSPLGGNHGAGIAGGVGAGFVFTNANIVEDFSGAFDNETLVLPFVTVDFAQGANGVWTLSATAGPGGGLGIFHYTTNTYTNPTSNSSLDCGCSK